MDSKTNKIIWIDYVRAFAILCVVLCHAINGIYPLTTDYINNLSLESKIFCFSSLSLGRLGVPCFLMISGVLFLRKTYDKEKIFLFWKEKWVHLLICTFFWFAVNEVFIRVFLHKTIYLPEIIESMLFINKAHMSHLWYMPKILGIYILVPFVAVILQKFESKVFIFPIIIFSLYEFGFALLNVINNVCYPNLSLKKTFSSGFSGEWLGLYLVFGYFIYKGVLKKIKDLYIVILIVLSYIGSVFIQIWSFDNGVSYSIWYDNLLLMMAAAGIFEIFSRLKINNEYRIISIISYYSFAIYLTHNITRILFADVISGFAINNPCKVIILWIISFVSGLLVSIVISKIPVFGKYILYLKNNKSAG